MVDEFTSRAAEAAVKTVEDNLIAAEREYQDAMRSGDDTFAGDALVRWDAARAQYDRLTGANQPQQQQQAGQLSVAQRNYLSRRAYGGDQLTPQRMGDYAKGHERAVAAGFRPDSPEYFSCVSNYVDHLGDGRQPPLDEREAAKICGVDEHTYATYADHLRALKRGGHYRD